jgi:hypothetical protein
MEGARERGNGPAAFGLTRCCCELRLVVPKSRASLEAPLLGGSGEGPGERLATCRWYR